MRRCPCLLTARTHGIHRGDPLPKAGDPGRTGAAGGGGDLAPSADQGPHGQPKAAGSPGSREGQQSIRQRLIKYI